MISQPKRINQSLIEDGIAPNDLSQIMDSYYLGQKDGESYQKPQLPEEF